MKAILNKITAMALAVAMVAAVAPVTQTQAASANLIKKPWTSYFGQNEGWAEGAVGTLTDNNKTSWKAQLDVIGYGGVWGAQVKNEKLKFQKGQTYEFSCTLASTNIDKWVVIKIEGVDPKRTDNPNQAILAHKWVQVKAGKKTKVSFNVTLAKKYKGHVSVVFGIGGEMGDREDESKEGLYDGMATRPTDVDPTYTTAVTCTNISFAPVKAAIKKVAAKKASARVTLKKNSLAKKYVIQYSTKSNMKKSKKIKTSKTKVTIKKLNRRKKYYFRAAIINKNGVQSKVWSKKVSKKIK